jgi:hypothetical protein
MGNKLSKKHNNKNNNSNINNSDINNITKNSDINNIINNSDINNSNINNSDINNSDNSDGNVSDINNSDINNGGVDDICGDTDNSESDKEILKKINIEELLYNNCRIHYSDNLNDYDNIKLCINNLSKLLFNIQKANINGFNIYKETKDIFMELIKWNDMLLVPFINNRHANKIREYFKKSNIGFATWNYRCYKFYDDIYKLLNNSAYFKQCELYDILCCIFGELCYNYRPQLNSIYSYNIIEKELLKLVISLEKYCVSLIKEDLPKLQLYMSLDTPYMNCTIYNISNSNFIKLLKFIINKQNIISTRWNNLFEEICDNIDNIKNNIDNIDVYLENIHLIELPKENIFNEKCDCTNIITWYINCIISIIKKSVKLQDIEN